MILEFSVDNNILKRNTSSTVLDQSTDYYKCKFYPDKDIWEGANMSATFMNDIGYIETVSLGDYSDLLACIIPNRIATGGFFNFYISSDDNRKTNTVSVALTNHYQKPEEKCNVISEIFAHIDEKIDDIVYENYQLKCYSSGILKDVIYLGNVDEELIHDLVQAELDAFKNSLATVAFTGSYHDLIDVPETFQPSEHEHVTADITDLEISDTNQSESLLSIITDEINSI